MFLNFLKNKKQDLTEQTMIDPNQIINGIHSGIPRYEYKIKVFELDDNDKPITSIQEGIKANSDTELKSMYSLCDQKIEIISRKEINPPSQTQQVETNITVNQNEKLTKIQQNPQREDIVPRYFNAGGINFKLVGNELYQKQWIRASEDETASIRIINDKNNSIFKLNGKHIELEKWIKVEQEMEKNDD